MRYFYFSWLIAKNLKVRDAIVYFDSSNDFPEHHTPTFSYCLYQLYSSLFMRDFRGSKIVPNEHQALDGRGLLVLLEFSKT